MEPIESRERESARPPAQPSDFFEILCSLLRAAAGMQAETEKLTQSLDSSFFTYAKRHRVAQLLTEVLKGSGPGNEEITRLAGAELSRNQLRGIMNMAGLGRIVSRLENLNIKSLCMKGPSLSMDAYGDLGIRSAGDLDILVEESQVIKTHELLTSMQFTLVVPEVLPRGVALARLLERSPHFTFYGPNQTPLVELHWRIFSNPYFFPACFEEVYEAHRVVPAANFRLHSFSNDYFALHLICHGAHHAWERLFWLHDVAALHRQGKIDPRSLLKQSERMGLERVAGQCFLLLNWIYKIEIPQVMEAVCSGKESLFLARHALKACKMFGEKRAPGRMGRLIYLLRLRKGARYRWRVVEQEILQLDKEDFITTPYWLLPLYALFRPVFWLIKRKKSEQKSPGV